MSAQPNPANPPQPRALLVDDHPIVIEALASALSFARLFQTIDKAHSLASALESLSRPPACAIVILDLHLPDASGMETFTAIREAHPDVPAVVFSSEDGIDTITAAFEGGARGFIPKDSSLNVITDAMRVVLAGSNYIPPHAIGIFGGAMHGRTSVSTAPTAQPAFLSPRQRQVLALLLQGMPNKVIGSRLDMAEGTVKTHLNTIYRVMGVQSRAQAILRAREFGLI